MVACEYLLIFIYYDDLPIAYSTKSKNDAHFSVKCSSNPTWRSSKDGIYVGGTSWSRPSAPYSIITSPKKNKKVRSCPGGVSASSFKPSKVLFSRNGSTTQSDCNTVNNQKSENNNKTSEYGSCEQSPTNACEESNDKQSEIDCNGQSILIKIYDSEIRKLKRKIKDERLRFRDQVLILQNENDRLRFTLEKVDRSTSFLHRNLQYERHKNHNLRKKIRDLENLIKNLKYQLDSCRKDESVKQTCHVVGAGEALCVLTQSSGSLFDYETPQYNDPPDEIRNFRNKQLELELSEENESPWLWASVGKEDEIMEEHRKSPEDIKEDTRRNSRRLLRRSFSDSQVSKILAESEPFEILRGFSSPSTRRFRTRGEWLRGGLDTSFSSEEDVSTMELIERQLRRRGDCVRFIPPRRTVREATFRRYGRRERSALAEFDYLLDLSTDASAIASSPDYVSSKSQRRDLS
ncbi:unnamed protein product [Dracunculus medinensis]|uniref:Uncharacterized protein n=1 Tax=Dracunculus medinensis TaxID=318479 RepID=A0A0N4UET8_DRAME|nr:unnamed protein product [Dracunculus medinensis]